MKSTSVNETITKIMTSLGVIDRFCRRHISRHKVAVAVTSQLRHSRICEQRFTAELQGDDSERKKNPQMDDNSNDVGNKLLQCW